MNLNFGGSLRLRYWSKLDKLCSFFMFSVMLLIVSLSALSEKIS